MFQIEHLTVQAGVSDQAYSLLGELLQRKKRQLAIRHLDLLLQSHVTDHQDFQTFLVSLNQNARLTSLTLNVEYSEVSQNSS